MRLLPSYILRRLGHKSGLQCNWHIDEGCAVASYSIPLDWQ